MLGNLRRCLGWRTEERFRRQYRRRLELQGAIVLGISQRCGCRLPFRSPVQHIIGTLLPLRYNGSR